MAIIELYHGSDKIVHHPMKGEGNPANDYGPGFYCTKKLELAYEWACTDSHTGFANKYELETNSLRVLNLNGRDYHILNWLAMLLDNRVFDVTTRLAADAKAYVLSNYLPEYSDYDLICGYRADDSYFSFARAFLNNTISLEQLSRAMRLGKLGEQIVIRSDSAYEALTFLAAAPADRNVFYPRRMARDREARSAYQAMLSESPSESATYVIDIIRQQWKNDDPRLR